MSNAALTSPRAHDQFKDLQTSLETRKADYAKILPKHISPDRFIRSVILACAKEPKLLECDRATLFRSVLQACQLGLDCSGSLGEAWIIPYGKAATLIIGYQGLLVLARRSGEVAKVAAHVVREGDVFEFELGFEPKCRHVPALTGEKPGKAIAFYMVVVLKSGERHLEVMSAAEVDSIKRRSKAASNGPWVTDPDEMGRKTVARRGTKWVPRSVELAEALALDHDQAVAAESSSGLSADMVLDSEPAAQVAAITDTSCGPMGEVAKAIEKTEGKG